MTSPVSKNIFQEKFTEQQRNYVSKITVEGENQSLREENSRLVIRVYENEFLYSNSVKDALPWYWKRLITGDWKSERATMIDLFAKICERWQLKAKDQMTLLGYKEDDSEGCKLLYGISHNLTRDVKDRAGYIIGISLGLQVLSKNDLEAEISWLRLPRPKLNGKSSIEFMLEGSLVNLFIVSEMIKRERGI